MPSYRHGRTGRIRRSALTLGACGMFVALAAAPASAAITGTNNANGLGAAITGAPVTGATLNAATGGPGPPPDPSFPLAISDTPLAGFPTSGPSYTIITSGDSAIADDPNTGSGDGDNLGFSLPARGEAFDPATLGVPVTPPAGANCLVFDYKFLSEEFPEFVNRGFNDAFIAELDGSSWFVAAGSISAPGDFAAAAGDRVSVDTVGPTSVTDVSALGTTYDAATTTLTTKAQVTPGPHVLYLSIFDSGDAIFDSAAFVDNIRFTTESPQTCKPPDIFLGQVGVSFPTTKFTVKGKTVTIPITCLLQVGITVNCNGTISLTGKIPKPNRAASRAKAKPLGSAAYSVAPGATTDVPVVLKKKAKKAFKFVKKLKGTATVTNSSNGAAASFKFVLKKAKKK